MAVTKRPRSSAGGGKVRTADLSKYVGRTVPDLVAEPTKLMFVGINPGLWSAATATHFARPGNRFYPALATSGITPYLVDARDGYSPADKAMLLERGISITNIVDRATARADQLTRDELRDAVDALVGRIDAIKPRVVAVLGLTSYRTAFERPRARAGRQQEGIGGAELWVLPNPSGLNAHETVASLASAYAEAARAAGIELMPSAGSSRA